MTFLESYGPESDWLVLDLVRQNGEADLLLVFSVDPGSSTELLLSLIHISEPTRPY